MKISPLISVYSLTLLLSAALLFSVQPMFSKMVLPLLGGTPQVWNTAMLFFQLMLLGGYAYAHGTTRYLSIRVQAALHIILLALFTIALPIAIPAGWTPPGDADPTLWQLSLMAATVGGPFFVLAGSAPMLQRWFSASLHKDAHNPYFLYGASNLGSITALLAYPVIVEPFLTLAGQSHTWMIGYFMLIGFTTAAISMVWRNTEAGIKPKHADNNIKSTITWRMRFTWMVLAFIPSSLMLGVTTFITSDIASVPMLWILPLALYVGTFILVFARKPIISLKATTILQGALLIMLIAQKIALPVVDPYILIGLHLAVFFFSSLTCHMELAKSRPDARHLTEFYLIMSIGGALGGFFNAIIAPQYMVIPLEYVFALVLACFARYATDPQKNYADSFAKVKAAFRKSGVDAFASQYSILALILICVTVTAFSHPSTNVLRASAFIIALGLFYVMDRRWMFASLVALVLCFFPLGYHWSGKEYNEVLHRGRNFFGILKIANTKEGERIMLNGTTNHGTQALAPDLRLTPLSYYSQKSPLHDVFQIFDSRPTQHIGAIGLGVGVTACFSHPGRSFDYFEINPLVQEIAENPKYFTFLKDCGSPYKIILGDGRLTLKKQPDANYDMIILDAFTSDNIPIHLMTLEALEFYFQKLKEDGILVVHISNRFLDLEPILQQASQKMEIPALAKVVDPENIEGTQLKSYGSHWVTFSRNKKFMSSLETKGWSPARSRKGVKLWTDDYSNIFMVLDNKTALQRMKESHEKKKAEEAEKSQ
jgi:spermidine synthase